MSAGTASQEATFSIPAGLDPVLIEVAKELLRIEENARNSQQNQFEQSKIWRGANLSLGIPAAVLAAFSGTAMLVSDEWRIPAGIISLLSAALATTSTTLSAERRSDRATTAGNAYLDIQTEARQLLHIDLIHLSYDDARDKLRNLSSRYGEINRGAEPVLNRARNRASKNLARGGQTHAVDREAH